MRGLWSARGLAPADRRHGCLGAGSRIRPFHPASLFPHDVSEYYEHALAERGYQPDEAQKTIDRLQRYYDEWVKFKAMRSNALKKLLNRPDVPRGVYLWGGVGRGKLPDGRLLRHRAGGAQDAPALP